MPKNLLKTELSETGCYTWNSGNNQTSEAHSRPCSGTFQSFTPELTGMRLAKTVTMLTVSKYSSSLCNKIQDSKSSWQICSS